MWVWVLVCGCGGGRACVPPARAFPMRPPFLPPQDGPSLSPKRRGTPPTAQQQASSSSAGEAAKDKPKQKGKKQSAQNALQLRCLGDVRVFPKDGELEPTTLVVRRCTLHPAPHEQLPKAPPLDWKVVPQAPANACSRGTPRCGLLQEAKAWVGSNQTRARKWCRVCCVFKGCRLHLAGWRSSGHLAL